MNTDTPTDEDVKRHLNNRLVALADGNIGALSVLLESFADPRVGFMLMVVCEARELKGSEIWIASRLSKRDPKRTIRLVADLDSPWIDVIKRSETDVVAREQLRLEERRVAADVE